MYVPVLELVDQNSALYFAAKSSAFFIMSLYPHSDCKGEGQVGEEQGEGFQ